MAAAESCMPSPVVNQQWLLLLIHIVRSIKKHFVHYGGGQLSVLLYFVPDR